MKIYDHRVKFAPTGKNFEPDGHFMVKICRNFLILVISGDLGWTLIPIVTILKIISFLLALFRAQNHDSSLKFTKKIVSMRFSENRSIKFSTFTLDFDLKIMKIWKSRYWLFCSSRLVDSESAIKNAFFWVPKLDGTTLKLFFKHLNRQISSQRIATISPEKYTILL